MRFLLYTALRGLLYLMRYTFEEMAERAEAKFPCLIFKRRLHNAAIALGATRQMRTSLRIAKSWGRVSRF